MVSAADSVLIAADVFSAMEYLGLEVRKIDNIAVGCPDIAYPSSSKVKERRTIKTPQTDYQYPAFEQLQLARFPDFG